MICKSFLMKKPASTKFLTCHVLWEVLKIFMKWRWRTAIERCIWSELWPHERHCQCCRKQTGTEEGGEDENEVHTATRSPIITHYFSKYQLCKKLKQFVKYCECTKQNMRGSQKVRLPILFLWKCAHSALWLCCAIAHFSHYQVASLFTGTDKACLPSVRWTMATILNEWTKEEVWPAIHFFWAKGIQPMEIHCELVTVYGPSETTVQHVWKWCRNSEMVRYA
jgi:hypothetical protein